MLNTNPDADRALVDAGCCLETEPRPIYERNKLRYAAMREKRSKTPLKDLIVVTTSTLAFLMSTTTTYLSTFRNVDDIRVIVSNTPKLWHEPLSDAVNIISKHALTFSNAGNRSAAILGLNLVLFRNFPGGSGDVNCEDKREALGIASSASYNLKPVILQPREISITEVYLTSPDASPDPDDGLNMSLLNMSTPLDYEITVCLCMRFYIATPDASYSIIQTLSDMRFKNNQSFRFNVDRPHATNRALFDQLKVGEWTLVHKTQFIFDFWHSRDAIQN